MIKRILVGIADAAYTASATRHGIEIARRCGASLMGVSIFDLAKLRRETSVLHPKDGYSSQLRAATFADATKSIDEAIDIYVRLCEASGCPFDFTKVAGDPFLEFIERSKYYDLMICGLRRLFEHGVLPEPKDELAKLVGSGVRPIIAVAPPYREIRKVLVAYSHSVESAATMRHFTQLQQFVAPKASVEIVSFGKSAGSAPSHLLEARHYMQAHGIEPTIQFIEGNPRTGVLEHVATSGADLVVLGNSAKSLLRRKVLGETALHTIQNAEVPLFLSQ